MPKFHDPNLIVGFDTSDDGAVYKLSDELAMIQTVDFFPPIVDDPFVFGQIAAANSLSDIYAMGGTPKIAMNLMSVSSCMSLEQVGEILAGGYSKVKEAGAIIAGGHTIEDAEPKYGLCVTGFVHPDKVMQNSSGKEGDVLIITKPLGLGILAGASMADVLDGGTYKLMCDVMSTLNAKAHEAMAAVGANACTDVTGFGLLGHGYEMTLGNGLAMEIDSISLPILPKVIDFARDGIIPKGAYSNWDYLQNLVKLQGDIPQHMIDIVCDPQTSGGLLIAVPEQKARELLSRLEAVTPYARIVGHLRKKTSEHHIILR